MDSFGTQVCGRYNGIPESEQNRAALWEQVLAGEYPGSQQVSEVSLGGCPWAVTGRIMLEGKVRAASRLSHPPGASACVSHHLHFLWALSPRQNQSQYPLCPISGRQHLVLPGLFISAATSTAAPFLALGSQRNLFETLKFQLYPARLKTLCASHHIQGVMHV